METILIYSLFNVSTLFLGVLVGFKMGRKTKTPAPTQQEQMQAKTVKSASMRKHLEDEDIVGTADYFDEMYNDGIERDKRERKETL